MNIDPVSASNNDPLFAVLGIPRATFYRWYDLYSFNEIFDGQRVFDNPKPVVDISRLVSYLCEPDDLVLDFFAGSGTTGHAVSAENANKGARRRFILVQLPEPLDAEKADQNVAAEFCAAIGKPANIAEITKGHLRRSAQKVRRDHPMFSGDTGFRVFKLASSKIRAWEPDCQGSVCQGSVLPKLPVRAKLVLNRPVIRWMPVSY